MLRLRIVVHLSVMQYIKDKNEEISKIESKHEIKKKCIMLVFLFKKERHSIPLFCLPEQSHEELGCPSQSPLCQSPRQQTNSLSVSQSRSQSYSRA